LRTQLHERDAASHGHVDKEAQTIGEAAATPAETIPVELSSHICALEERLATHSSEANEQFRSLAKAHNRLTLKAREKLEQASQREAHLFAKLSVRQATVAALVGLYEQQRFAQEDSTMQSQAAVSARLEAERQLSEVQGSLLVAKQASAASAVAAENASAARLEAEAQLAEVQGLLVTSQQTSASATSAVEVANSAKLEAEHQVSELQARLAAAEQGKASAHAAAAAATEATTSARLESEKQLTEIQARVAAAEAAAAAALADAEAAVSAKLAAEQQIAELKGRLFTAEQACELGVTSQKQLEAQLEASQQADSAKIAELESRLSQQTDASASMESRAKSAEEDATKLEGECESLRMQSRELLATVEAFRHDLELAKSELRSVQEAEEMLLCELNSTKQSAAKMGGHANHRQKIQYTINIKNENVSLRGELMKARQRIAQLEVGRHNDVGVAADSATGASSTQVGGGRAPRRTGSTGSDENSNSPNLRSQRMMERALDTARAEYQHLRALVDRAALSHGTGMRGKGSLEWLRQVASRSTDTSNQELQGDLAGSGEKAVEDLAAEDHTSANIPPAADVKGASEAQSLTHSNPGTDSEGEAESGA